MADACAHNDPLARTTASRGYHGGITGHTPEPRRSTSNPVSEVLRRGSGEAPGRFARGTGEDRDYSENIE